MPRKPKYPNPDQTIQAFFNSVSDSYNHPSADEAVDGKKKQELLAEEFGISRIKVRKTLITTGDLSYPQTKQVQEMVAAGMSIGAVAEKLGMAVSTVNSLLPYSKGVYKLSEVSAAAERTAMYRARKEALDLLHVEPSPLNLWRAICLFQTDPFTTSGRKTKDGVKGREKFKYNISEPGGPGGRRYAGEEVDGFGNELFVNGREKGISRSSVDYALKIATTSTVTGPKQLRIYGSSYVYSIFVRFGLIEMSVKC